MVVESPVYLYYSFSIWRICGREVYVSNKELELMQAAFEQVRKANNTREKALAFLVGAGIATLDGKLAERYR